MTIRVALEHVTRYHYDRMVTLGPQTIRLRPAPHCRTPIDGYSLTVRPSNHFLNWQQDPYGNFLARAVFEEATSSFEVTVDLIADMTVINPFEFFVEESAEEFPFEYDPELKKSLQPFLECQKHEDIFYKYLAAIDRSPRRIVNFIVDLNQRLQKDINYLIRLEPGVQTPSETLSQQTGSCRDSAWLAVQLLRHIGIASRFVSGYLIQLTADQQSLDGPSGPTADFTDLHAWAEVFLPGAGWVGLDPTSGLLTGEGHVPLAATASPQLAAPISGGVDPCEVEFDFQMKLTRIHEDPRVTKPYTEAQWQAIDRVGNQVDEALTAGNVGLTMGGEPTFVSVDDMESAEWNTAAVGLHKQQLSDQLVRRLRERFAPGGVLHFGQGKWYPGEPLPRWAYSCVWRTDGEPIWQDPKLLADVGVAGDQQIDDANAFMQDLAVELQVDRQWIRPAFEDVWHRMEFEQKLPVDLDPQTVDLDEYALDDPAKRRMLATLVENRDPAQPSGYLLPLTRAWWQAKSPGSPSKERRKRAKWLSGPWPVRSSKVFLIPGDSPIGLRLPLDSLPANIWSASSFPADPFAPRAALEPYSQIRQTVYSSHRSEESETIHHQQNAAAESHMAAPPESNSLPDASIPIVGTALCIEPRDGRLHVFLPPVSQLEDFLELLVAVETTAERRGMPVVLEGYLPPSDPRIQIVKVTPDPGVIEVNIHPARNWAELKSITRGVYEEARNSRLGTEKFQLDGRHSGTGGGNHIVMGGESASQSPFLRRPHLLKSLIGYWNNHPALSYLFSGNFIGPTSQAPRVDEGRRDAMYELEIAFDQIPESDNVPSWLVDRVFRNLLVDLTGNTHRAEICIDKLFSPDQSSGRLGLVEFRGFEMPPHADMSLAQQLLVRALVAKFWNEPYREPLIHWGTAIHDRFMLPHWIQRDFDSVIADLSLAGFALEPNWFAPHFEFRFPKIGSVQYQDMQLELRQAIEPWYVLGEEPGGGGTARYVDSSVERLQVRFSGNSNPRYAIACNGIEIPLVATEEIGTRVGGLRDRKSVV